MFRKISIAVTALLAVAFAGLPVTASAQDENQKRQNVSYWRVVNLNFKPGHNQAAWAIMYTKIAPAVRASGRDFVALDWESGPWDSTVYIRLGDSYDVLDYATAPGFIDMMAALAEAEGSEEAAEAVWAEWTSHIDNSSQDVGHMHVPPSDDDE